MASFLKARRASPHVGVAIHDVVVSGVESVTDIGGGMVRAEFFVNRKSAVTGLLERVVLPDALVMPISMVPDAIGKAMIAIGRKIIASEDGLTVVH